MVRVYLCQASSSQGTRFVSRETLQAMKIEEFEVELRELNADLSIRVSPNNPEMSGIYWRGLFICGIPSGEIFDEVRPDYKNSADHVHRTRPTALAQVNQYLWRIKNEPGFEDDELSFKP